MSTGQIRINSQVTLKCGENTLTYQIVSPDQVNPFNHKISLNSPLGKELVKNQAQGKFVVQTPRGQVEYEIVEVKESA